MKKFKISLFILVLLYFFANYVNANGTNIFDYKCTKLMYKIELEISNKLDCFYPELSVVENHKSYLSAIFVANEKEKEIAELSRNKVVKQFPEQKVITPILDATTFYPIKGKESYHQNYYKTNPVRYNYYRWSCGRDSRLKEIWGDKAVH